MKKEKKVRVYFSMEKTLHGKFEKFVEDNMLDQSKVIEKLIEEF
jgi:hypothetical protein